MLSNNYYSRYWSISSFIYYFYSLTYLVSKYQLFNRSSSMSPFIFYYIILLLFTESPERSQPGTEVFFMTEDHFNRSPQLAPPAGLRQIVVSTSQESISSSIRSDHGDESFDEDFCIIDDPGMGIAVSLMSHLLCFS